MKRQYVLIKYLPPFYFKDIKFDVAILGTKFGFIAKNKSTPDEIRP
jgi:hypothetical protein